MTIRIGRTIKITTPSPRIRWAFFFAAALFALAVRLPRLGERPMHTDESVNAYITGELLAGKSFHYDPQDRHGPALFVLAEPVARLLGANNFSGLTESQLRLSPVLAGTATVLLFGAGVEMFGFIPCLVAALLFAFAPLPLYYSRYFIHETLFVAVTLGLILSGWQALRKSSLPSAALAGFCAALMLACKETAALHFFAVAVALFVCRFAASRHFGMPGPVPARTFGILTCAWTAPGAPGWKIILAATTAFLFTFILLFTWFGRDWQALPDLVRAIPNFAARAGGEGHQKPFWYYLKLLAGGGSGGIIFALAVLGFFRARGSASRLFLAIYALLIITIYSAIPYKTPWLALNFWLPLALLAGLAIEWIWFATTKLPVRAAVLVSLAAVGSLIAQDTRQRVFLHPADENNPYAYAHTVEDLLRLPPRLAQLARQENLAQPRIAVVAADPWPLPWYLRKYSQVGFWQPGQNPGAADFFITSPEAAEKLGDKLKNFRPEYFGVRPEVLIILWSPWDRSR
ncbi:MAG: TIGR03663 family protein [Verrucomicrobiota bacterium]|nr:TIGR03663 family protein [Verrucomicrobiota bacterium]